MAVVKKAPSLIKRGNNKYCTGCGHSIFLRLISEVVEELGYKDKFIMNLAVGCSCNTHGMFMGEAQQCPHGRPASVATGAKRTNPDLLICTYQGDGDAYVIGMAETMNAAYRGENITTFIVNNALFGMTGGQMGWTTLPGMITKTTKKGRDCEETGYPFKFPEIAAQYLNASYVARGSVTSPKEINNTKKYIKDALEAQINGEGYSVVEILSPCPTNWHMSAVDSLKWIEEKMYPHFQVGVLKERKGK